VDQCIQEVSRQEDLSVTPSVITEVITSPPRARVLARGEDFFHPEEFNEAENEDGCEVIEYDEATFHTPEQLAAFEAEFGDDPTPPADIPEPVLLTPTLPYTPEAPLQLLQKELPFLAKLPDPLQTYVETIYLTRLNEARYPLNWSRERSRWYSLLSRPVNQEAYVRYLKPLVDAGRWNIEWSRMVLCRDLWHWNEKLEDPGMEIPKWIHKAFSEDDSTVTQPADHVESCLDSFGRDPEQVQQAFLRLFKHIGKTNTLRAFWYLCSKRSEFTGFFYDNILRKVPGFTEDSSIYAAAKLLETRTKDELDQIIMKYEATLAQRDKCWDLKDQAERAEEIQAAI
jgi:hypothetical protein